MCCVCRRWERRTGRHFRSTADSFSPSPTVRRFQTAARVSTPSTPPCTNSTPSHRPSSASKTSSHTGEHLFINLGSTCGSTTSVPEPEDNSEGCSDQRVFNVFLFDCCLQRCGLGVLHHRRGEVLGCGELSRWQLVLSEQCRLQVRTSCQRFEGHL